MGFCEQASYPRIAGLCSHRQKCSASIESEALVALLDLAVCGSLIASR